jgi:hypothetical protein
MAQKSRVGHGSSNPFGLDDPLSPSIHIGPSTRTPSNDFAQIRPEVQSSRILSQPQVNEHEIQAMEDQRRRLQYFTDTTNEELRQQQEQEVFVNLSIVNLFEKLSTTIITIMNELLALAKDATFNDVLYIFVKEDRLVYIGFLAILVALAIYLIDITS